MKFKTTLRLFIVVCFLGGLIWLVEQRFESTDRKRKRAATVFPPMPEDVSSLTIEREDGFRVDCVKKAGTWFLEHPLKTRAEEAEIDRILSILERMPRKEIITAAQRRERELTLKDYGFLQPRARFVFGNRLSRKELLVGHDAPLGNLLYVKLAGAEDVIATFRSIFDTIPQKIQDLRDRTILHGDPARTVRVEIQRHGGGFIQLAQTAGKWVIQQPICTRADSGKISQILNALYALKVEKFVWDPAVEQVGEKIPAVDVEVDVDARVAPYDLAPDKAAARITVWVNGDEVGKELILGKRAGENGKEIYAKCRDINSIYTVGKNILDVFSVSVDDLRDRNLFSIGSSDARYVCFQKGDRKLVIKKKDDSGWVIVEPIQWKADDQVVDEVIGRIICLRVEKFVEGAQTNLAEIGLDPFAYIVQVAAVYPASTEGEKPQETDGAGAEKPDTANRDRLLIGMLMEGATNIFVKFEDSESVFEVSAESVRSLGAWPLDALAYCERTILAVPSESIRQLSILKDGTKEAVARDDSGSWVSIETTNQVNREAIEDILFFVSNMRALRIESHNPENLAVYGLDRSVTTLTLGLSGDEGIQKSLIMGFQTETGGIYAMVQGQDVVFVLDKALADRLTKNLVRRQATTGLAPAVVAPKRRYAVPRRRMEP